MPILDAPDTFEDEVDGLEKHTARQFRILSILWMVAGILGITSTLLLAVFIMTETAGSTKDFQIFVAICLLFSTMSTLLWTAGFRMWQRLKQVLFDEGNIGQVLYGLIVFWVLGIFFSFLMFSVV